MKSFYLWIGTSVALLLGALFFRQSPGNQGWLITLALLCLTIGFLWRVCRNS